MKLTLVILAAGMGSRYGGMKQLDRVGPSGETIMEYSVYDAIRAGFTKVVFVIRKHFEEDFREVIVKKIESKVEVALAFQETDHLPEGFSSPADRIKPWGTGHALWSCNNVVEGGFAVINADDFYGREAYQTIAEYLKSVQSHQSGQYAMCGYSLKNTLSEHGEVSRGLCRVSNQGMLQSVEELLAIAQNSEGHITSQGKASDLKPDDIVSMNFWGFFPDVFNHLNNKLKNFLNENINHSKAEFFIPAVVDELIRENKADVRVLKSGAKWFGVTYKEDKELARQKLSELVAEGYYPPDLW